MYGTRNQQTTTTTEPSLRSSTSEITPPPTQTETEEPETSTTEMVPDNSVKPDLCKDSKIDAITTLGDKSVYVFKGIEQEFDCLNSSIFLSFWTLNI